MQAVGDEWAPRTGLGSAGIRLHPGVSHACVRPPLSLSPFLGLTPAHDSRPRAAGTRVIANSRRPH